MIITCSNCGKKFKINPSLIPVNGRNLKCGSCDHVWFHKIEDKKSESLNLEEDIITNNDKSIIFEAEKDHYIKKKKSIPEDKIDENISEKQTHSKNQKKENVINKIFSYLVVSIISFVALIILLDTFKTPLINVFPGLEIILFNLFEILKDIKLFIIDLY
tara:strand:+ start:69 stop:548 length:480 start_codon:yes stop_codon:yes gene_type:complete